MYLVDMPMNEAVCPCGAFGYTIYINAKLSEEGRQRALNHALKHIDANDWGRDDIQQIESEAHA